MSKDTKLEMRLVLFVITVVLVILGANISHAEQNCELELAKKDKQIIELQFQILQINHKMIEEKIQKLKAERKDNDKASNTHTAADK
jgi:competence protein ComGC